MNLARRLENLELAGTIVTKSRFFSARILLVHPEDGLTGVLLPESGKPTIDVPPTQDELESVRAALGTAASGARNS